MTPQVQTKRHSNEEREVVCPVEQCDETPLARGVHLHVLRSSDDHHGPQGDLPDGIDFDNLETAGARTVDMDYPEHRDTENVARMCTYCERPFRGKHGVMIHLGQVAGRKNHPSDATTRHEPDDFPVVHVDDAENVVEVADSTTVMPSTEQRREDDSLDPDAVKAYIRGLRAEGRDDEADRASRMLGVSD